MATTEEVSVLRIRGVSEGLDAAAAKLKLVGAAQDSVTVATERVEKRQISAAASYEKLMRQVDQGFRAQRQYEGGVRTLDRALSQGVIGVQQRTEAMRLLEQRTLGASRANDNFAASAARRGAFDGAGAGLTRGLDPLTQHVPGAGYAVGLTGMSAGAAGIAASVAGITAASVAIARAGDEWTGYINRLKAAGEDQGMVNRRMDELTQIAMRSRSQLAPTIDLYAGISKSTQDLGKSQTDVARVTETIAKAFTIGGQSASTASGAILQLNQAFAAGALRGDELNSVLEGAPPLARLIAAEFGIGVGELKKFGEEGKITADRVFNAFLQGSREIDTTFGNTALTMSQASTNAGTALTQLGAEMDSVLGISQRMAKGLDGAAGAIMGMVGAIRAFGDGKKIGEIQALGANIEGYQRQLRELEGRKDYASIVDRENLTKRMAGDRGAYDRLVGDRIGGMVGKPEQIMLNGEGMLTTARAARTYEKALEDINKAAQTVSRDGMEAVARATAEANDRFSERAKVAAKMRADGVENAKINAYEAQSQKLLAQEIKNANDAAAKKGGGGSTKGAEDAFARSIITAQGRTQAIQEEMRLVGLAGSELEAMRLKIELETQAKRRGLEISDAVSASILKEVDARRAASQALSEAKLAYDAVFEREQLGRTDSEARIAQRMRGSGLDMSSPIADTLRLNDTLKETKDLLSTAATGFVSDLRAGKTAAEALQNQADRIVTTLLNAAMNKAITGLFGGIMGAFGGGGGFNFAGTPGGAFSFGAGGYTGAGPFLADGGYVSGPGGPRSDSINAWLSNGEFVVNAASTSLFRPQLEAMNSRRYADGGYVAPAHVPRPYVHPPAAGGGGAGPMQVVINNHTPAQVEAREVPDGNGGRKMEVVINEAVSKAVSGAGPTRDALRSNFGAKPRVASR